MEFLTSLAASRYAANRPATEPAPGGADGAVLGPVGDFARQIAEGEATVKEGLTGTADPHSLVQALAETQLAIETAVTVRDRVVEAYQEILRMPV